MAIVLESVEKWYNRGAVNEVHAIRGVSLTIPENEVLCIQGPSGSGKSSLLGIIGCLFTPSSGLAMVEGRKLSRLPDRFLTIIRRQTIGFIFQRFQVIPELSVLTNVTLPLLPLGLPPRECDERARVLLEKLAIGHRADFPAAALSGGELQRAVIARALIGDPPIICADEPTAHLDTALSLDFMSIMAELQAAGKTIVITSHDPLVSGHHLVDRSLSLRDGRLST
jgi:putative ABC transport system ATP-binding protein